MVKEYIRADSHVGWIKRSVSTLRTAEQTSLRGNRLKIIKKNLESRILQMTRIARITAPLESRL
ncbi:MAG: hypothetical protein ABFS56_25030 [Pseudomonadota bacterium]